MCSCSSELKITTSSIDLGSLLSPQIEPPRVQAGPLVYAYQDFEILDPTHGSGYINTTQKLAYMFVGDTWVALDSGPLDQIYPPSGVAVSTGASWAASIPQANIALLNAALNTFTGAIAAATLSSQTLSLNQPDTTGEVLILAIQPNLTAGQTPRLIVGHSASSLDGTQLGFFYSGTPNTEQGTIGITGGVLSSFDQASNWHLPGTITCGGGVIDTAGNAVFTGSIDVNNPNSGSGPVVTSALMTPSLGSGGSNGIYIGQSNTPGNCAIYGFDFFGNGSSLNRGTVGIAAGASANFDAAGDWIFSGTITAAAKSFRIPHPTREGMKLVHGCPEGPEWAVYYRGESAVIDGEVEIELPDYFETLTREEGRSVLLTAIFDGENEPGTLAASRVENGKFTVTSSVLGQEFWWEVKAVRADVELLEIEQKMTEEEKALAKKKTAR